MNRKLMVSVISLAVMSTIGCARIETGEVGLRKGFDKQIKSDELLPGSFNQTIIGEVLTFPTKDVSIQLDNLTPMAKDNSTMKDFDATVIYGINPSAVSDLYVNKNRGFHAEANGDIYLMYNYLARTAQNAAIKAAREHEALTMNDNRAIIEARMKTLMSEMLAAEKLDGALTIQQVQVRAMHPADTGVASANELVRAKNELAQKEVEVKTAEAEARRMAALSNQSASSIAYMQAQAALNISEGIKNGKVNTIVVPANFNALMMGK